MLQKIPKNKDRIAVLVNSKGGCLAQTHIILRKIGELARRNKAQVWTFGQEWALNAGFLLLASGHRVFVDGTTVVGGLEVGESKILRGKLGEYIDTVTYTNTPSYLSELNSSQSFLPEKKAEVQRINSLFSEAARGEILKYRAAKLKGEVELGQFYMGEEAVKAGLADGVDRVHLALARESINYDSVLLDKSELQKWLERIRRLNISD
jgi:ClpP class serine protease